MKCFISFTPWTEIGIISPCSRDHAGICASELVNTWTNYSFVRLIGGLTYCHWGQLSGSRRVRKLTLAYFQSRYHFQQYVLDGLPNGAIAVEMELRHGFRIKGRLVNQSPNLGTTMPLASTPPAQSSTKSSNADLRRARKQIQLAHVKQLSDLPCQRDCFFHIPPSFTFHPSLHPWLSFRQPRGACGVGEGGFGIHRFNNHAPYKLPNLASLRCCCYRIQNRRLSLESSNRTRFCCINLRVDFYLHLHRGHVSLAFLG